jgi:hypothetical protein
MDRLLKTKGYKIIRNVIPHNLLNDMILLIAKRFTEITKQELKSKPIINFNVSKELEDNLLNLRENKPEIFSYLYDSVQSSVSLNQLITYKKLINNLCKTTGIKKEFFSTSGHIQRIDNPYDKNIVGIKRLVIMGKVHLVIIVFLFGYHYLMPKKKMVQ